MPEHAPDCPLPPSQEAARAWREEFPGHCPACDGRGVNADRAAAVEEWERRGFTVTYHNSSCDCLLIGRCPRCGHALGDELPCRGCDWQQPADGCPAEAACTCGRNEITS